MYISNIFLKHYWAVRAAKPTFKYSKRSKRI